MRTRAWPAGAVLLVLIVLAAPAPRAWAGPPGGASIQLDRTSVRLGQRLYVTLSGWTNRNVTVSVCGNLAMRGTADCNLVASQALKLLTDPTVTEFTVFAPPGTCPCVIRVSTAQQDEVAVVPIDIVGVATGPVVGPGGQQLIAVSARLAAAPEGIISALRSALGGPTSYIIEVTLHNLLQQRVTGITITASVRNGSSASVNSFDIRPPDALRAGGTWVERTHVTVPAPAIGSFDWRVTVSGAGAPTGARVVNRHFPLPFVVLLVVFVADIIVIVGRFMVLHVRGPGRGKEPVVPRAAAAAA